MVLELLVKNSIARHEAKVFSGTSGVISPSQQMF
jgi:hypothetical protein